MREAAAAPSLPPSRRLHGARAVALIGLLAVTLCGCAAQEARNAYLGRTQLVGLSQSDVRMCAGFPTGTAEDRRSEIWTYEHGGTTPGGLTTPALPLMMPWGPSSVGVATDGYCRVQLRFVKDRVAEVEYAGATDVGAARNAFCSPIIRTCLSYKESGPKPAPPPSRKPAVREPGSSPDS